MSVVVWQRCSDGIVRKYFPLLYEPSCELGIDAVSKSVYHEFVMLRVEMRKMKCQIVCLREKDEVG